MKPAEQIRFAGKYPMKVERKLMGHDANRENEECWENRIFMYLGPVRLDCTDYNPAQIQLIVNKLILMGLAKEQGGC